MKIRSPDSVLAEFKKAPVELMAQWRERPALFAADVLRMEYLPWQEFTAQAIADAKAGKINKTRFAIKSGTGVGKTALTASLILWMLACFEDVKIPCTAPNAPQLKAVLWPELRKFVSAIPEELRDIFPFDVQVDRCTIYNNFAVARTPKDGSPEGFQGFHALNIMLVADEASGVPDDVYLAGQGVMAEKGAITLLIGNPTRVSGYFYKCFTSNQERWWCLTVSCEDSPRVTKEYIDDMRTEHGENSYEFKVRVLGEFHLEESGVIIPINWVRDAIERDIGSNSDYEVWGFDVSDGKDRSALAKRKGNKLLEIKSWGGKSALASVGVVVDEYYQTLPPLRPKEICVDAIGMGATAAQRLAEILKGEPVVVTKVNVALTGERVGQRYRSRRVELWARGRKWFEDYESSIPPNLDRFMAQISSVEWEVNDSSGKWVLVDKKASGSSPDEADAFLLTFGGLKGDKNVFTNTDDKYKLTNRPHQIGSASYLLHDEAYNEYPSRWS